MRIFSWRATCREPPTHRCRYCRGQVRRQHVEHVIGVGTWRVTEPMAELSCEMSLVAKAAAICNLAQWLSFARPTVQKVCGMIQTKRIYELTARGPALCKEFMDIA